MIVIGAVLLILAALGTGAVISTGRNTTVRLDGWGFHLTTNLLWVFAAGAIAMLLLLLALSAFRRAARKRRRQRRELKQARAEEAAAAQQRGAGGGAAVDVREPTSDGAHAYRAVDDPGPERRFTPGDDTVR